MKNHWFIKKMLENKAQADDMGVKFKDEYFEKTKKGFFISLFVLIVLFFMKFALVAFLFSGDVISGFSFFTMYVYGIVLNIMGCVTMFFLLKTFYVKYRFNLNKKIFKF